MWTFTTKGFLSIVQHDSMHEHFQVKARVATPLEELWPGHEIQKIDWADYRFRITIRKDEVIPVLAKEIESIHFTRASRTSARKTTPTTMLWSGYGRPCSTTSRNRRKREVLQKS